jgi:hypothetical protein
MNLPDPNDLSPDLDDFRVPLNALDSIRARAERRRKAAFGAMGACALVAAGLVGAGLANSGDGGAPGSPGSADEVASATTDGAQFGDDGQIFTMGRLATLDDCDAVHDAVVEGATRELTTMQRFIWDTANREAILSGRDFAVEGDIRGDARFSPMPDWGESPDAFDNRERLDANVADSDAVTYSDGDPLRTSTTNTAVAGVDESDLIDTDGATLVAVRFEEVVIVNLLAEGGPTVTTHHPAVANVRGMPEVYLDGDVVWVISQKGSAKLPRQSWGGRHRGATTTIVEKLVLDADRNATLAGSVEIDGALRSSRSVDGTLRLVVDSDIPELQLVQPTGPDAVEAAQEANRAIIAAVELDQWVPTARTHIDGTTTPVDLLACDRMHVPTTASDFGVTSVVTLHRDGNVDAITSTTLLARSDTIGASADRLYLSSTHWETNTEDDEDGEVDGRRVDTGWGWRGGSQVTDLHAFVLEGTDPARYQASGSVPGSVLNEFGISESDGVLRVASTVGGGSDNRVTTLADNGDGTLEQLGEVTGLGKPGETIRGVRFVKDKGYVVTFRTYDPLYVLDLSDPYDPTVEGELEITGFSAYLHPLDDGRLVGVGVEADNNGRTTGAKVTLFDVSDPKNPTEASTVQLGEGRALAADEHHAFLYWQDTGLIALPGHYADETEHGVKLLRADGTGLEEIGELPDHIAGSIKRTVVIGDEIWALSEWGLSHHDLETFEHNGYLSFKTE